MTSILHQVVDWWLGSFAAATLDSTASEATLLLTRSAALALSIDRGPWLVLSPSPPSVCSDCITSTPTAASLMPVRPSDYIGTLGHPFFNGITKLINAPKFFCRWLKPFSPKRRPLKSTQRHFQVLCAETSRWPVMNCSFIYSKRRFAFGRNWNNRLIFNVSPALVLVE